MRKSKFNFFAILGLVVALGTVAFTAPKENIKKEKSLEMHWYPVDGNTNKITGPALFSDSTKDEVIDTQGCKDTPSNQICLYGSEDGSLEAGDAIQAPSPDNTILRSNP